MAHRSIRIPDDLDARITARASVERRTFSAMAVLLLERALSERGEGEKSAARVAVGSRQPTPRSESAESSERAKAFSDWEDHFKPDPKSGKQK